MKTKKLLKLIKQFPNDMELGARIRYLIQEKIKNKLN